MYKRKGHAEFIEYQDSSIGFVLRDGYVARIDRDDYERLAPYKWYLMNPLRKIQYAACSQKDGSHNLMHRFIMNCPKDKIIDHLNHDGLDNRKENLRICNYSDNLLNTPQESWVHFKI